MSKALQEGGDQHAEQLGKDIGETIEQVGSIAITVGGIAKGTAALATAGIRGLKVAEEVGESAAKIEASAAKVEAKAARVGEDIEKSSKNLETNKVGDLKILDGVFSESEQFAAKYLSKQGKNVVLRPATGVGKTSDLLVNGVAYDVYTPTTSNVNRVISAVAKKNSQAAGVVLDLRSSSITADQLKNVLSRVRGSGAKDIIDVIIIK